MTLDALLSGIDTSPLVFEREVSTLFRGNTIFVGHVEALRTAGASLVADLGS